MEKILTFILTFIVAILISGVVALILGIPVMLLWNLVMPDLLGVKEISYLQAVGLNLLCGLLFYHSSKSTTE